MGNIQSIERYIKKRVQIKSSSEIVTGFDIGRRYNNLFPSNIPIL
jgi:hypothetical protein